MQLMGLGSETVLGVLVVRFILRGVFVLRLEVLVLRVFPPLIWGACRGTLYCLFIKLIHHLLLQIPFQYFACAPLR